MLYCFNCGKPVIETDRFCPSCGAKLYLRKSATQDSERRFPTPPFASPEQTQHPSRTRLLTPSEDTEQTRDFGKTRLIDSDREESEPIPASSKTRLMSAEDITRLKTKDKPPFCKAPRPADSGKPVITLQPFLSGYKHRPKKQSTVWLWVLLAIICVGTPLVLWRPWEPKEETPSVETHDGETATVAVSSVAGPSGAGRIAFDSDRDGDSEIFVMDSDGRNQTQLTYNSSYDWYPAWSPDGSRIAFHSDRDGDWEIFVMDADGRNQTQLTNNTSDDYAPAWCPVE